MGEEQDEVSDDEFPNAKEGVEGCSVISMSKEETKSLQCPWKLALIITVLGKKARYNYLLNWIVATKV